MGVYEVFVWIAWAAMGLVSLVCAGIGCVRWIRRGGFHDLADSLEFLRFRLRQSRRKDRRSPASEPPQRRGGPWWRPASRLFIFIGALINVVTTPFAQGSPSSTSGLDPYQPEMVMTIEAEQVSTDEAVVSALTDGPHDTVLAPHLVDIDEADQQHYAEVLARLRHHVRDTRAKQLGVAAKADELADGIRQRRVQGRVVLDRLDADDDLSRVIGILARVTEPAREIAEEMTEPSQPSSNRVRKRNQLGTS